VVDEADEWVGGMCEQLVSTATLLRLSPPPPAVVRQPFPRSPSSNSHSATPRKEGSQRTSTNDDNIVRAALSRESTGSEDTGATGEGGTSESLERWTTSVALRE